MARRATWAEQPAPVAPPAFRARPMLSMGGHDSIAARLGTLPYRLVVALLVLHAAALLLDYGFGVTDRQPWRFLHYQLNLDRENNIPSWVSTLLLAWAAGLLAALAMAERRAGRTWHRHWALLAATFAFLSLDEMCSFHERLSGPLQRTFDLHQVLTNAWVLAALPPCAVLVLALVPFLRALPRGTRRRFLGAGAVYMAGVAGVELISGWVKARYGFDDVRLAAATTLEEALELTGVALFIHALTDHVVRTAALRPLIEPRG